MTDCHFSVLFTTAGAESLDSLAGTAPTGPHRTRERPRIIIQKAAAARPPVYFINHLWLTLFHSLNLLFLFSQSPMPVICYIFSVYVCACVLSPDYFNLPTWFISSIYNTFTYSIFLCNGATFRHSHFILIRSACVSFKLCTRTYWIV